MFSNRDRILTNIDTRYVMDYSGLDFCMDNKFSLSKTVQSSCGVQPAFSLMLTYVLYVGYGGGGVTLNIDLHLVQR
jgi:hypothetical protein